MALPITVPYTFGNATTAIPLSNLDSDYATVYQAVNGIGNGSVALANVTITGGTVSNVSGVVPTPFTANGVVYASSTSALATGSALVFDGNNLGLGVLGVNPSAWSGNWKSLQSGNGSAFVGYNGNDQTFVVSNAYNDGSWKYKNTAGAGYYSIQGVGNGVHTWYNAPSGTAGNAISFTQAMTLDANNNLLVGTTSAGALANNNGTAIAPQYGWIIQNHVNGAASGTAYLYFGYNAGVIGSITQSGTTAVLFNVTSDQRLKENIVDAPEFGDVIDSIQVRSYDWKTDQTHQRAGFIAQELVTIAPEAVHQPADPEEMMAVDYSKLVPMLVKEIQSLRKRILTLENK